MPGRKFACWRTCTPPRNDSAADTSPANVLGHRLFREEAERIQVDSFWSYRVLRLRCKNKQVRRAYCRRAECLAFHLHRICLAKSGPQLGGNGAFGGQTAFSLPLVTKQIRTFAGIDSPHFLPRCFVSSSALLAKESYANRCRLAAVPFGTKAINTAFCRGCTAARSEGASPALRILPAWGQNVRRIL